jgi:hypothetical protein
VSCIKERLKHCHGANLPMFSSPDPPVGHLEDVAVPHDDWAIVYNPGRRCVRHFVKRCTKWFDPWVWREEGPSGSILTYRSTVSSYRTSEDPAITLEFQGMLFTCPSGD